MQNVLITGAAGRIGGVLREGLMDNYLLRLTDRSQIESPEAVEVHIADVTDVEEMAKICFHMQSYAVKASR